MSIGKTTNRPEWVHEVSDGDRVIRIIRHEAVPQTGSYEVQFPDGRPSRYFYWNDIPDRRSNSGMMHSDQALLAAMKFARAKRDKQ